VQVLPEGVAADREGGRAMTGQVPFRAGRNGKHGRIYEAETASGPTTYCADVSEFQPDLNDATYLKWSRAIVVRAMYGDAHDDKAWYGGSRRAALHKGGVSFLGCYQYLVADQDPTAQAKAFIKLVGKLQPGELPICDLEVGSGNQDARWSAWSNVIRDEYGIVPWLYSGAYFAKAEGLSPQWVAAYQSAPPSMPHLMWQFSESYSVPGVGKADCSVFGGTLAQLAAHAFGGAAPKPASTVTVWVAEGQKSLADLCAGDLHNAVSTVLRLTAEHSAGAIYTAAMGGYINQVAAADKAKLPAGVTVWYPKGSTVEAFTSHGTQTLQGLANTWKCEPSTVVRLTAEHAPGAVFSPGMASYLNGVFVRSALHVPAGMHLFYES
jgi:hypothetical protein